MTGFSAFAENDARGTRRAHLHHPAELKKRDDDRCRQKPKALHIKSEQNHIPVLYHIFPPFLAPFACLLCALFPPELNIIRISDDLSLNKSLFKISMNNPCCLWRCKSLFNRPSTCFLRACSEIRL